MLKVIIRSVGDQYVLEDNEYEYIMRHLNQPLSILSLTFDEDTNEPWMIAVRVDKTFGHCICLFIDSNEVKYEFVGSLVPSNRR